MTGQPAVDPGRIAALEDPRRLEAVGAQAPPRAGRVVRRACRRTGRPSIPSPTPAARPSSPPSGRARRGRARRRAVGGLDDRRLPVEVDGARDVAGGVERGRGAVGPPAHVDDAQVGAAEVLGQPFGAGDELGAGELGHAGLRASGGDRGQAIPADIIRAWSPRSCRIAEKIAAIRALLPATGAGIYLNAGGCGPDARRDPARRWTSRPRASWRSAAARSTSSSRSWSGWPRRARRRRGARRGPRRHRADPLHDRRDQPRRSRRSPWRAGRPRAHHEPRAPGRPRAAAGAARPAGRRGRGRRRRRRRRRRADPRRRSGRALERPGAGRGRSATCCGRPAPCCRWTAIGTLARDAGAVVDHRRRAGGRGDPGPARGPRRRRVRGARPEVAARARGHGRAVGAPRRSRTRSSRRRPGYLVYAHVRPRRARTLHPGARRFEATGFHRPSRRSASRGACGWLSMYVGLPWAHGARAAASRPARGRPARRRSRASRCVTPPEHAGDAGHVPDRGLARPPRRSTSSRPRAFAILRDLPPIDALRISVGFWTTEDELERFAAGVELLAAPHARDHPAAPDARDPGQRWPAPRLTARAPARAEVRRRGFVRGPLAPVPARARGPVFRAVVDAACPSRSCWAWLFLAYDVALDRGADLPGRRPAARVPDGVRGDRAASPGAVITWLVVPLPTGSRARRATRTPWSLALGPVRRRPDRLPRARRAPRDREAAARRMTIGDQRRARRVPAIIRAGRSTDPEHRGRRGERRTRSRRPAEALRRARVRAAAVMPVAPVERPFDPDDLPLEAEQTDEERELAQRARRAPVRDGRHDGEPIGVAGGGSRSSAARPFRLRDHPAGSRDAARGPTRRPARPSPDLRGGVAQSVRAAGLYPAGSRFESWLPYHPRRAARVRRARRQRAGAATSRWSRRARSRRSGVEAALRRQRREPAGELGGRAPRRRPATGPRVLSSVTIAA